VSPYIHLELGADDSIIMPKSRVESVESIPRAMADALPAEPTANISLRMTTPGISNDEKPDADVKADEQPPTPPEPLVLELQTHLEQIVQPGAFRVAPGNHNGDQGSLDESDDEAQHVRPASGRFRRANDFEEEYLVEADLVQDPEPQSAELSSTMLVEAQPLRRWNVIIGIGVVLIVATMVGVTLGVVQPGNRSGPPALTFQPSPTPSGSPSTQPSSFPTIMPSRTPSMLPSTAPTPVVLLMFRNSLPSYTTEQLSNASTSQSRALEWIATDDRKRSNLWRMTQRFALATLYFSTSGQEKWGSNEGWINSTMNECGWFGCECTDNGTIRGLNLDENRLVGAFPKEVSLLQNLATLQLSWNTRLRGTLPSEIGRLTAMRTLEMGDTGISGKLPAEIGNLTMLEEVYLSGSSISGTIPAILGRLTSLVELSLSGTRIFGPIPSSVGLLHRLTLLSLVGNQLSSTIPIEIGNLSSLSSIDLSSNLLIGAIPSSLWQVPFLDSVVLSYNSLNSTFPTEVGQALRLTYLNTEENNLVGTIPTQLGILSSLTRLSLNGNQLEGTIPTELGLLTNLGERGLYLQQNLLTGTLPTELGLLSNVRFMNFYQNQLRGSVPAELCALVSKGLDLELECDKVICNCTVKCNCWNETAD
jgi:Leucine-rich repeat (LRR) protein